MRLYLVFIFCLLSYQAFTQTLTISGKVLDRLSREPLPYASVWIQGKSISTITNLQGEFDFHLPSNYRNEIMVISMLGYNNYEAPVWSILSSEQQTLLLDKSTTVLNEVVVADSLSGAEIFMIALSRIGNNYPTTPFLLDGFYRDIKKVGGTYISMLEAAVKIYDEGYDEPRNKFRLRERVRLIEVRQSLGYENKFTAYFDQDNLLEDLLLHNNIRYRQFDHQEFLSTASREADSYYNGHPVYVISYNKDISVRAFIDKSDYSIIQLEFESTGNNEIVEKRKGLYSKFVGLKKTLDFRKVDGKMFLSFMTMTSKINWYEAKSNKLNFETELHQQLLINQVEPNTSERIASTEKMKNYGLQYQDRPYNKQFWDNYNVIKDTPVDKRILVDLEKVWPIEKNIEN